MSATVLNEAEGLIQIILALYLINTKFEPGLYGSHAKLMRLIAPAGVYLVTRIPYYLLPALWQPIAFLPVLFAYLLLCREGRLGPFLLWSVLSVALLQAVGALYNLFALYAFGLTRAGMAARPIIEQSQFLVGRAFLSGLAFYIVSRIGKRDQGALPVPRPAVALMVILPVLSIGVMLALDMESIAGQSAQNASSAAQQDSSLHILILAASLGVLCLNIIVVAIYNILSAQAEKLAGQEELRQRESMLRQHSDEIRTLYAEMRTWRHDFRNHLHALHGLLESARYGAAGEYLDSIESSVEKIEQLIHTGNDTLDAILNAKISLARA
ncbi:MAG: Spo0B domain-containing protein, partial [Defluviitaleaceae bacterium]|nr:Spo0B domain-containing protein [Defluviitaleaceae bacterium]